MTTRRGFTILEILVVIVVVGILATVAVYALNVTRAANRDDKRISDVSVLRAGLSQYWLEQATYPASTGVNLGEQGANADKLTSSGFVSANDPSTPVYLLQVPVGPKANEFYYYHGSASGYSIKFTTERPTVYGAAGTYYAHSSGVDKDNSEK